MIGLNKLGCSDAKDKAEIELFVGKLDPEYTLDKPAGVVSKIFVAKDGKPARPARRIRSESPGRARPLTRASKA